MLHLVIYADSFADIEDSASVSDSSRDVSLDPDMLSISSDSEHVHRPGASGPGFLVFKGVLRHLVSLAQVVSVDNAGATEDPKAETSQRQDQPPTPISSMAVSQVSTPNRKRQLPHDGEGEGEDDEDERGRRPSKKLKHSPEELGRAKFLACPFWKLDSKKHWECFLKKLDTISHLKMHLDRRHTPKFYCDRCYSIFENRERKEEHLSIVNCRFSRDAKLDGITREQKDELSRKRRGSAEERWFKVWDILFPSIPRPLSIYQHPNQPEMLCQIRELGQQHGVGIFLDEIRHSGIALRPGVSDDELREVVQRAMDNMFEYFRIQGPWSSSTSTRGSDELSSGGRASAASNVSIRQDISTGSDSGIGVASQYSFGNSHLGAIPSHPTVDGVQFTPQMPGAESLQRNDLGLPGTESNLGDLGSSNISESFIWDQDWGPDASFDALLKSVTDPGACNGTL
jgi:hypothetical protein